MRQPDTSGDAYSAVSGGVARAGLEAGGEPSLVAHFIMGALVATAPVAGALASPFGVDDNRIGESRDVLRKACASAAPTSTIKKTCWPA
jgi:hypothetical protein